MEDSACSGPTQETRSPWAPDGEGDRAASLPVRPLLHSRAHTKKRPEERSLRHGRFLVQVRRMQARTRPRDRGSSAPLAPPRSVSGPHLLPRATVSPGRAAPKGGSPPTTRGQTPRRFSSFFKRRSSVGRRRRSCRLLPPPLLPLPYVADRGHSAGAKR